MKMEARPPCQLSYALVAFLMRQMACPSLNDKLSLCWQLQPGQEPSRWYRMQSVLKFSPNELANSSVEMRLLADQIDAIVRGPTSLLLWLSTVFFILADSVQVAAGFCSFASSLQQQELLSLTQLLLAAGFFMEEGASSFTPKRQGRVTESVSWCMRMTLTSNDESNLGRRPFL